MRAPSRKGCETHHRRHLRALFFVLRPKLSEFDRSAMALSAQFLNNI